MTKPQLPVLIIGAGPTGLMAAICLEKWGVPFRILEKAPAATPYSKALAIQARTLEIFQTLGIADPFLERGVELHGGNFYINHQKRGHLDFTNAVDTPYPFVLSLAQNETEQLLNEQLKNPVEREKELLRVEQNGTSVLATVVDLATGKEEIVAADWLLACDGPHSIVRKQLQLPFIGDAIDHFFVLADIKTKFPLSDREIHAFLTKDWILAFFPFDKNIVRIVANLPKLGIGGAVPHFHLGDILELTKQRTGLKLDVEETLWISPFRINSRMAQNLRKDRVFLVGDAFHIHSPVGGQGMNTGLQDAHNLVWKLAQIIQKKAPASLLDTYEIERKKNALRLLKRTNTATKFIEAKSPLRKWIRNTILPFATSLLFLRKKMINEIAQLDIDYLDSPLSRQAGRWSFFSKAPKCGRRLPPFCVFEMNSGEKTSLLDLVDYTGTIALLFSGTRSSEKERRKSQEICEWLLDRKIAVHSIETEGRCLPKSENCWLDREGHLHKAWKLSSSALFLIRPDGYVGFRSHPIDREALQEYLNRFSPMPR